jgi:hypothetical protein
MSKRGTWGRIIVKIDDQVATDEQIARLALSGEPGAVEFRQILENEEWVPAGGWARYEKENQS